MLDEQLPKDPRWNLIWTEEKIAVLKSLHSDGVIYSEIARRLGTTRGSVSGKVDRLGLVQPEREPRAPRPARIAKAKRRVPFRAPVEHVEPAPSFDAAARTERACDIMGLTNTNCHWPVGDVGSEAFFFCGEPAVGSKSYCAGHYRVSITRPRQLTGSDRERRAGLTIKNLKISHKNVLPEWEVA